MHDRTPIPKTSKFIKALFGVCFMLMYIAFSMLAFCVLYYAKNIFVGIFVLIFPLILSGVIVISIIDMQRSYVEILGTKIRIVDFYCFQKKEKLIDRSDIDRSEIIFAHSMKLRGRRLNLAGVRYIVFYNKKGRYLFKILETPEATEFLEKVFKREGKTIEEISIGEKM